MAMGQFRRHGVPEEPTPMEREAHEITHIPAQQWCRACVLGKALGAGHKKVWVDAKQAKPVVQIDYSFIKADGADCTVEDAFSTTLSLVDESTGLAVALAIPTKTSPLAYVVKVVVQFLDSLGHPTLTLRSDGEPAILQLVDEIAKTRSAKGVTERSKR